MTLEEDNEKRLEMRRGISLSMESRICSFCGDFTLVYTRHISTICMACISQCALKQLSPPNPKIRKRQTNEIRKLRKIKA